MDDSRISRPYLESLTSGELAHLADCYGIDVPPGLERIFIIEELLYYIEDDTEDQEPSPLVEAEFLEPVPLPKQYNITFIEVMIRDPLWVFIFWEVKGHDRELFEKSPDFAGYYLRVVPTEGRGNAGKGEPFTVPVGTGDNAWYLGFPPEGGRYTVALCVRRGEEELTLAVSRLFRLPELIGFSREDGPAAGGNPLIRLSGAEDLSVLRNMDRLSRTFRRPDR